MYSRSISWFICISVAAVMATDNSVPDSTTGSNPEVTVYALRTENAETSTMAALKEVNETAATDRPQREQQVAAAESSAPPPATADSGSSAATQPHSERSRGATSAATPTPGCLLPSPDDGFVSYYKRRLSAEEKGRALISAAKYRKLRALPALLVAGADVGTRDDGRRTALHWAASAGDVVAVRCLIEAGAEVNASSRSQVTPLHVAAAKGHTAVVQMLVASDADPNAKDEDGRTPLHHAAYKGHVEVVTTLLAAGAHTGVMNNNGDTPVAVTGRGKCQRLTAMLT